MDPDNPGNCRGFDIDCARALSSAIFGNSDHVSFVPLSSGERFSALRDQRIDVGFFNASANVNRETMEQVTFVHPVLYDGETFMHRTGDPLVADDISLWSDEIGIAVLQGSTTAENLEAYFRAHSARPRVHLYRSPQEARQAYLNNECQVYCLDKYLLYGERSLFATPGRHRIRQERISFEYMSPVTAYQDHRWSTSVALVMKALIAAEEVMSEAMALGIRSTNDIRSVRLFRFRPEVEQKFGLRRDFVERVVHAVGTYADLFERNIGSKSDLKAPRAENIPRSRGGLLSSPLFN